MDKKNLISAKSTPTRKALTFEIVEALWFTTNSILRGFT